MHQQAMLAKFHYKLVFDSQRMYRCD